MNVGGCQIMLQEHTRMMNEQILAMTYFTKYIKEGYTNILHPFAGVGMMAQVIDRMVGAREHTMWERDKVLVDYLWDVGYPFVTQVEDSYVKLLDTVLAVYDVVMYDQMTGTIKRGATRRFWRRAHKHRVPLVWMTDSGAAKIWLHKDHYLDEFGRRVEDAEDYLRAYNDWLAFYGYVVVEAWMEPSRMLFFAAVHDMNSTPFDHIQRLNPSMV